MPRLTDEDKLRQARETQDGSLQGFFLGAQTVYQISNHLEFAVRSSSGGYNSVIYPLIVPRRVPLQDCNGVASVNLVSGFAVSGVSGHRSSRTRRFRHR